MRMTYDPSVDALTIRFVEERVECEGLNDQVAVDIGPGERIVAIEILDASELISGLQERGVSLENLKVFRLTPELALGDKHCRTK